MRFYNILLCVFIMFLFSSCGKKETINETNIPVISENDYFSADIVSKTENSVRFKETISFTQAYPNSNVINLTNLEKPREDAQVIFVDNAGNIYYVAERGNNNSTGSIFSYNYSDKSWTTLVETSENHNCTVVYANESYVLWREDNNANWLKVTLHLLDLNTKKCVKIYDYSTDPNTGLMYSWQFSTPVIIGDNVYFDDIVGKNRNELYDIKMYSYSITRKRINTLDEAAKWPMEFQGKAAWLKMSSDEKNSLFYSAKKEKFLLKAETRLGTAFTSSKDTVVANDYMSQAFFDYLTTKSTLQTDFTDSVNDPAISSYGIKLYKNNQIQPIIVVNTGFITNPVTNGDLIGWYGSSVGKPLIYSCQKNVLIEFDQLGLENVLAYDFKLSDNYLILSCATGDNKQYVYMFNLK